MHPNTPKPQSRTLVAEVLAGLALLVPAAAIAAEPAADAPEQAGNADPVKRAQLDLGAGPKQPILAPFSPLEPIRQEITAKRAKRLKAEREQRAERAAAERERKAEREQGPFHPVVGEVSYGSAEAAFGNARGRPHEGQDIFAPGGTTLISPTETVVVETGTDDGRGNWAALYDPAEKRTYTYFHMIAPAKVSAGEKLGPGDRVGEVGCTGSCSGEHLHFEIRDGKGPYGQPRDPLGLIEGWKRWRG